MKNNYANCKLQVINLIMLYCVQAVDVSNGTDICAHGINETGPPKLSDNDEAANVEKVIPIYSSINQTWTIYSNLEANLTFTYQRQENANQRRINETFGLIIERGNFSHCTSFTLKIPNVTENHFGKYYAVMKNDKGRFQITLLLKSSGPLPPRDFKVDCYPVAQFARVYWKSGSYDRLNTKFNVYYRQRDERNWTAAHTNIFGNSTNVFKVFEKLWYSVERYTYIEKLKRGSYEFRLSSIKLGEEAFSLETKACNITGKDKPGNKASVNSRISVSVSFLLPLLLFFISY